MMTTHEIPSILIVEDNQDDCEATMRSLKKSRFLNPVDWCKNGKEAWDYLSTKKENELPDLILLDLNMPGLDGRQLLAKMKNSERLRQIPVVILTTSADSRDIDKCYDLGASTYIQKPVSFEGLTEAIRTMKDYWFGVALLPTKRTD